MSAQQPRRLARRTFLRAGVLAFAGLAVPWPARSAGRVEIRMRSDAQGAHVWFDPVGVLIEPGQTVRWVVDTEGASHTSAAYHPHNGNHSLRIPEAAAPWDSGFLVGKGAAFEVTLTEVGVYDYFCLPHEMAGMVGRLVVRRAVGPGSRAFDYFRGQPGTSAWLPVPPAARKTFPGAAQILEQRIVRLK
jgi:plastocyanin